MATLSELIRNVIMRAKAEGVDETAGKLRGLSEAHAGVAVATEKTERSTLSLENRLNSIQRSLDAEYRSEQQLTKIHKDLDAARSQGLITVQRQNELLTLASAKYNAEGESAKRAAEGIKLLKEVSIGFIAGVGAGFISAGIAELPQQLADAVERLGNTANTAETIGVTTKALQELRFAARESDVEVGTLDDSLAKFSTNLAKDGGPLQKVFAANQVKITGDVTKDLEHYADLIKNATDQEQRNQFVAIAFGKSAQEMGRLFNEGGAGIARWAREADYAGAVLSDDKLQRARELNDEMEALKPQLEAAQAEFALLIMPAEITLLSSFNEGIRDTRDILTDITELNFGNIFTKLGDLGTAMSGGVGGLLAYLQAGAIEKQGIAAIKINGGHTEGTAFGGGWGSDGLKSPPSKLPNSDADAAAKAYDRLIENSDKRIAQLKAEKDALDLTGLAADSLKNFTDLLGQAEAGHVKITEAVRDKLHEEADAMAAASEALAGAQMNLADSTPFEQMGKAVDALSEKLSHGAITARTYNTEIGKSADQMAQAYGSAANDVLGNLDSISDAIGQQSKEAFEVHKALALAKAVVSGGEAIVHSYSAGTAIGGPITGAIFAGIAAAATAAQIAAIASTSYQSTNVSNATGSAGAVAASAAPQQQAITIVARGAAGTSINLDDFVKDLTSQIADGGHSALINVIRDAA